MGVGEVESNSIVFDYMAWGVLLFDFRTLLRAGCFQGYYLSFIIVISYQLRVLKAPDSRSLKSHYFYIYRPPKKSSLRFQSLRTLKVLNIRNLMNHNFYIYR